MPWRVKLALYFSRSAVLQMASAHTQGAKLRTPKGFNKLLAVNLGFGVDQHGQDATVSMDSMHADLITQGVRCASHCQCIRAGGSSESCEACNGEHSIARSALHGARSSSSLISISFFVFLMLCCDCIHSLLLQSARTSTYIKCCE